MTTDGTRDIDTALDQIAGLLTTADTDAFAAPTPCSDWTVADLTDHLIATTGKFADIVNGHEVDWSTDPPVTEDRVTGFAEAAARLRDAYAAQSEGDNPDWQCAELAVHTWDLASGLGRNTRDLAPAPAERGLVFMRANLRDDMRGEHFGPSQPTPDGADAYQAIAAFAGRRT